MPLQIIDRPAVTVVGLQIRTTPMSPDIPALWPRFVARIPEITPATEAKTTYGVMHNQSNAGFDYLACVAVEPSAAVPAGMTKLTLPAGRYAFFSFPFSKLGEGFGDIFERQLPASAYVQAAGPLFERYGPDFCPDEPGSPVEVFVPVAPKAKGG
ncbi:GyrI-like domain-containing protein [Roseateles sp. P5_E1]